jgi:hypothetical protein
MPQHRTVRKVCFLEAIRFMQSRTPVGYVSNRYPEDVVEFTDGSRVQCESAWEYEVTDQFGPEVTGMSAVFYISEPAETPD